MASRFGSVIGDGSVTCAPRCPQWWQAFRVLGRRADPYVVYADDIGSGIMRCTCPSRREDTCWHVQRVMRHGCLAGPHRAAGPNDLAEFDVAVVEHPKPRLARRVDQRCACGEALQVPNLRLTDDAGHQLVRVVLDDTNSEYGYAWAGEPALRVGDTVPVRQYVRATVVGLGSDWAGPLTVVGEKPRR